MLSASHYPWSFLVRAPLTAHRGARCSADPVATGVAHPGDLPTHAHPRRDRDERGPAADPVQPPLHAHRAVLGDQRVLAGVRWIPAAGRAGRRPVGPSYVV